VQQNKYYLPFGGSTNSAERLQERRVLKRIDKKKEREALKERIMNDQDPWGWSDSGASSNYVNEENNKHTEATGEASNKKVGMPTGEKVRAGERRRLKNGLRHPANTADTIPGLKTPLVSAGKTVDANYIMVYDKDEVNIYDAETTQVNTTEEAVMTGWQDRETGLWRLPLTANVTNPTTDTQLLSQEQTNAIVEEIVSNVHDLPSTEQVVKYLHAAAGFPTKSTWLKAINAGFYASWPMINARNVNKYFPESEETQKGHMRQKRSGVRKTNRRIEFEMIGNKSEVREIELSIQQLKQKQKDVMTKVYRCNGSVYSDQTGRFPFTSSRRCKYIMVMCEIDSNYILVEPMTSRKDKVMIATHKKMIERLRKMGLHPKMQHLDNEASDAYKAAIEDCGMTYQLITPHVHRANIAEKAIQTFKYHFTAILSGVDDSFPVHLWDQLLPQAEATLNMLRAANAAPNVSAYMYTHGNHDFNAHPFAPLGCAVQLFETPEVQKSWDPHSVNGWYIGTSMEHYRNHKVYCKKTSAERISDTV
jgi:hypothetical protein